MKKALILVSLIFSFSVACAAIAPEFIVNDARKECRMYQPDATHTFPKGWRVIQNDHGRDFRSTIVDFQAYCSSLGYIVTEAGYGTLKPVFLITRIIFVLVFALGVFFNFRRFLTQGRKSYIKFFVSLLLLSFVLLSVYPYVLYLIEPCASPFFIC
jgi:hypothetical protein